MWETPPRYCADGVIKIDNSAAERVLRSVSTGQRNYLLSGADSCGERATAIYSLIGTAKLNWFDNFFPWNCAALISSA